MTLIYPLYYRLIPSAAYLPSTFAMYGTTLAHAFSLQPQSRTRTVKVVCAVGITAILSWPFASVLVCVLGLQDLVQVQKTKAQLYQLLLAILKAGVILFFFLVPFVCHRSQFRLSQWQWTPRPIGVFKSFLSTSFDITSLAEKIVVQTSLGPNHGGIIFLTSHSISTSRQLRHSWLSH